MMKILKTLLLVIVLFFSFTAPASASVLDGMVKEDNSKSVGNVELKYKEYPLSHYNMETRLESEEFSDVMPWGWDEGFQKSIDQMFDNVLRMVWNINKNFAYAIGWLIEQAFSLNVMEQTIEHVSDIIKSIAGFDGSYKDKGFYPFLLPTILVGTAIWGSYKLFIQRQGTAVLSQLLHTLLILIASLSFFAYSDKLLIAMNDISTELQTEALSVSTSLIDPNGSYDENEAVANIRNMLFTITIYQPYLQANYGTTDEAAIQKEWKESGNRIDELLKTNDFSKDRQKVVEKEVEELKNNNMRPEALNDRIVYNIFAGIMNGLILLFFMIMSSWMIVLQILAIFYAVLSIFAFLISLIPAYSSTAWNVFGKMVHTFILKIGVGILMTMILSIGSIFHQSMQGSGNLFLETLIWVILIGVAIWKRQELFGIVTAPTRSLGFNPAGASLSDYKKTILKTRKVFNKVSSPLLKPQTQTLSERTGLNKLKASPGIGVVNPTNHPMYAPTSRPVAGKTTPAAETKTTAEAPVQRNTTAKTEAQPAAPSHVPASRENIDSLTETTNKGGWAYQNNTPSDEVTFKNQTATVDRMKDRAAVNETTNVQEMPQQPINKRNTKNSVFNDLVQESKPQALVQRGERNEKR
jgi:hypothetical protein